MSERKLPVRPDVGQLKRQAKDLLRALRKGDPDAVAALRAHHPKSIEPEHTRLADSG